MNILASVYACSPYDGSERAVGWTWVYELNKFHNITAITSAVYKNDIEDYKRKNPNELLNVNFVYVEVPKLISSWHVGYRGERLYYILWQYYAYKTAKNLIKNTKYDLVHHITYVTCILPSFMHKLDIPFLYGPVAGGDNISPIIQYPLTNDEKIFQFVRNLSQFLFTSTFNFKNTVSKASKILVTTEGTKNLIPLENQNKVEIFQAIGMSEEMFYPKPEKKDNEVVRFLMVGRMITIKGFKIGVNAFVKALELGINAELVILGDTENSKKQEKYKESLIKYCGRFYNNQIKIISKVEFSKMKMFYDEFDVLLNCTLRDSGCFVVMEAMSRGIPIITIDTGGPKVNTTESSAIKIAPMEIGEMENHIADAILTMTDSKELRGKMGMAAREHAWDTFRISKRVLKMNQYYEFVRGGK